MASSEPSRTAMVVRRMARDEILWTGAILLVLWAGVLLDVLQSHAGAPGAANANTRNVAPMFEGRLIRSAREIERAMPTPRSVDASDGRPLAVGSADEEVTADDTFEKLMTVSGAALLSLLIVAAATVGRRNGARLGLACRSRERRDAFKQRRH